MRLILSGWDYTDFDRLNCGLSHLCANTDWFVLEKLSAVCCVLNQAVSAMCVPRYVMCLVGGSEGAATGYQVKQLEQQNERMKEALVK